MNTNTAYALATEIAWQGHAGDSCIARLAAKAGIAAGDVARVVDAAVSLGMLKPVPGLGGYVAGRKVNERIFGKAFADM